MTANPFPPSIMETRMTTSPLPNNAHDRTFIRKGEKGGGSTMTGTKHVQGKGGGVTQRVKGGGVQ